EPLPDFSVLQQRQVFVVIVGAEYVRQIQPGCPECKRRGRRECRDVQVTVSGRIEGAVPGTFLRDTRHGVSSLRAAVQGQGLRSCDLDRNTVAVRHDSVYLPSPDDFANRPSYI